MKVQYIHVRYVHVYIRLYVHVYACVHISDSNVLFWGLISCLYVMALKDLSVALLVFCPGFLLACLCLDVFDCLPSEHDYPYSWAGGMLMAHIDGSTLTELCHPTRLGMRFMFGLVWLPVPGSGALIGLHMRKCTCLSVCICVCMCVRVCMRGDVMDMVGRTVSVWHPPC